MSFFSKMQNALANWMQGRNGPDNLGFTALVAAIVFSLLSLFRLPLTSFLSMLCYVYALWRMLSRRKNCRISVCACPVLSMNWRFSSCRLATLRLSIRHRAYT